jgi:hypothetical protein
LERRIAQRIELRDILDVLVDTENWPAPDYSLGLRPGREPAVATASV